MTSLWVWSIENYESDQLPFEVKINFQNPIIISSWEICRRCAKIALAVE